MTDQHSTDVEKALAIHDWVCDNIYYDYDVYYKRAESGDYSALDVLQSRRSICAGYANLTAALLKAAGITTRAVSGYALGLSAGPEFPQDVIAGGGKTNHAWNMAFIDGEWTYISRALQFLPADRRTRALRYRRDIDKRNCVVTY